MAVPKLRFPGFEGEWKERKLGEIAEIKDSARISNEFWVEKGVPYLRSSDLVNNELQGELFISKETYNKYSLQTGFPQKGDVLFTSGGKVGVTHHKEDDSDVYVQGGAILYVKTSTSEILKGSFLNIYFSTHKMRKYMENASVGGTIKHFTLIPANATPIIYPSIKEQQKIGSLFKVLDKKIQLQHEKIDLLKEQKKGFMQKIFSQKLRFKDEDGQEFPNWQNFKLKELTSYSSSPISIEQYKEYEGEEIYPLFDANKLICKIDRYSFEDIYISIIKDGAGVGRIRLLPGKSSIVGTMGGIQSKDSTIVSTHFIYYFLQIIKFSKYISGSTIPHIYFKDYGNEIVTLPDVNEQEKIVSFFSSVDYKLERESQKLEKLLKQKQSFMQQMFI